MDDLFTVDQVNEKTFDCIYPTLYSHYNYHETNNKTLDKSIILRNLYKNYPIIKGMNMTNVLIAGGAICNAITDNRKTDLDIFIYGVDEYGANQTMFRILDHLSKLSEGYKFKFIKIVNALTIHIDIKKGSCYNGKEYSYFDREYTLQIIFRLYKTKSEILHSFDMGSACVGFDGTDILFTTLSKFSYEYGCNIVDNTRRSTTYERRLVKYFRRGFKIIMPLFDINVLNIHKKYIILPRLLITAFNWDKNCIYVNPWKIQAIDNTSGADYDTIDIEFINENISNILDTKLIINWIKQDPSKILSASFHSIDDTEYTWYGMYLLKPEIHRLNWIKSLKRLFCGAF